MTLEERRVYLEEIRARHDASMPGPYAWVGNDLDAVRELSLDSVLETTEEKNHWERGYGAPMLKIRDADREALAHSWADREFLLAEVEMLQQIIRDYLPAECLPPGDEQ